jgi:hypothetical protein
MDVCETKAKEDDATVRPRRFALQYNPPTLVVEYSQGKGPRRRLFHQRIHLKAVSHVLVCVAECRHLSTVLCSAVALALLVRRPSVHLCFMLHSLRASAEHCSGGVEAALEVSGHPLREVRLGCAGTSARVMLQAA